MEEKFYAILLNKFIVDSRTVIYKPDGVVKGYFEGKIFIDEVGINYLRAEDVLVLYDTLDRPIIFAISEEDLILKYSGSSLEDKMKKYYEEYQDKSYFGILLEDKRVIKIVDSNFDKLFDKYNDILEDSSYNDKDDFYDGGEEEFKGSISFDSNYLDELLNSKTLEEIKGKLLKTKGEYDNFVKEVEEESTSNNINEERIDVSAMKRYFDERIIGLEDAKQAVILTIFGNRLIDDPINKSTCLIIGDTGTGKSMLCSVASEYLNIPIAFIDLTNISAAGYEGESVTGVLENLLRAAGGDVEKAQRGIIVLEEIDKKGSKSNSDIEGKAVLNSLLAFIQGHTYTVKYQYQIHYFNTSNITFFATGAFTNVIEKLKSSKKTIGFNSDIDNQNDDELYLNTTKRDLENYGLIPREVLSRITDVLVLPKHTKSSLRSILTDSIYSALVGAKKKLEILGVELYYTDGYLDSISEKAEEIGEGARSLNSMVNKSLKRAMWEVAINQFKYSRLLLTEDSVYDNRIFFLYDKDGLEYKFTKDKDKSLVKDINN